MDMPKVALNDVLQHELLAIAEYDNPLWDVAVEVQLTGPSGQKRKIDAFWDGTRTWRFRFAPTEVGEWTWKTICSNADDTGLQGVSGSFMCTPYEGENPVLKKGPVKLSDDRLSLAWSDGEPFFWLADTAWNGVLKGKPDDWSKYLSTRKEQKFTAIQFVSTQWRAYTGDKAFEGTKRVRIRPEFFQKLDEKVEAINRHGLIAAPVVLWALTEKDPGSYLPEADAIKVARYIVARWGAHQVIWLLGGDGHYHNELGDRWRRIGRAVFGEDRDRLVTMHPCGIDWVGEEFRSEPWFDFIGYQSGHGDGEHDLKWLTVGPPATDWPNDPQIPVINLEPNYETHPAYQSGSKFTAREVRRASYWSLLVSPAAGVTYGINAIWWWSDTRELPLDHEGIGIVDPWDAGLDTPGVRDMTILREFFETAEFWKLRPAQEVIADQPGTQKPEEFIAAARSEDGSRIVVYAPVGGTLYLKADALPESYRAEWFDPRTGQRTTAEATAPGTFQCPSDEDWVLRVNSVQ